MASTIVETQTTINGTDITVTTLTWTAHTDGTVTSTETKQIDGYVFMVTTQPGSPAPTADYDLALHDSNSVDIAATGLEDRHTTANEQYLFTTPRYVAGALTCVWTNQSVNGAKGVVTIYSRTSNVK